MVMEASTSLYPKVTQQRQAAATAARKTASLSRHFWTVIPVFHRSGSRACRRARLFRARQPGVRGAHPRGETTLRPRPHRRSDDAVGGRATNKLACSHVCGLRKDRARMPAKPAQ